MTMSLLTTGESLQATFSLDKIEGFRDSSFTIFTSELCRN
jgi:hypothetical protein